MSDTNGIETNKLIKGATITGVTNAIINAAIQYFMLRGHAPIPVTVDSISNNVHTVLGAAVPLAIGLAMILTVVSYYKAGGKRIGGLRFVIWLVFRNGVFTFGIVTAVAVLWQRLFGTIEVSMLPALVMIGVIAGVIAGIIEYSTIKACIVREALAKGKAAE